MYRVQQKDMRTVWMVSAGTGLTLILTAIASMTLFRFPLMFGTDQLLFIALIAAIFPPAIADYVDSRWKLAADKNIPEFLRELAEAGRTGLTLTRALHMASKRRYGPLSKELERIAVRLSWGGDLDEALKEFAERVDTKLARRTSVLISEINRSGGEIKDVLEIVSKHARELQRIDEERRSQLKMYVYIIVIAFLIFLFIDVLLLKTFFARLGSMKEMMVEAGGLFSVGDLAAIQRVMFHMCEIEALFGGLVAGKMGEGAIGAGLKHSVVLATIALITFNFIV
jgi:flagellar protein FlaJ